MNKKFFSNFSFSLICVLFFISLVFSFLSKSYVSEVEYVSENSGIRGKAKNLFTIKNAPIDLFVITFKVNYFFIGQSIFNIIPDDKFEELKVNGEVVSLDKIKKGDLENWEKGFVISLGKYLKKGENFFEIKLRNRGGDSGLAVISLVGNYLFYFGVFNFILMLLWIFLRREFSFEKKNLNFLFILLVIVLAYFIRLSVFHFVSGDFSLFLNSWYDHLRDNGLKSFAKEFSNYSPMYLYLLGISTFFPVDKLSAIKIISIIFDFVCGFFVFKIVFENKKDIFVSTLAFGLFMIIPTVIMNGAFWGQCDIIFATFCVISIYYMVKKNYLLSFLFYSIAFSFKLQAIFIAPVYFLFFILGKYDIKYFFLIPFIYFVSIIPAVFMGGKFIDLLLIYFKQTDYYRDMAINAPTFYQWFSNNPILLAFGFLFCCLIVFILLFVFWNLLKKQELKNTAILYITFLFSIVVPFFMPRMHERYFFMADIFSFILAFFIPSKFYLSLIVIFVSMFSYGYFLFGKQIIPFGYLSFGMLLVIILSIGFFFNGINKERKLFLK
ncbi:MAG: hypothetical protein WHS77_09825 [Brevinematales bacterium]